MTELLDCMVVQTGSTPAGSVIWLHGLGADGHDFEPIVPHLGIETPLRFVFPHAPVRPVTINGGIPMRAWYDIIDFDRNAAQDEAGIKDSAAKAVDLIDHEVSQGIPSNRIVLAGFSQGGAIALYTGVRFEQQLAGVMALSTYMPVRDRFEAERNDVNETTPFFMGHGQMDPVLPLVMGREAYDLLIEAGYQVTWQSYPIAHNVSPEEIMDIRRWLASVFDDE